MTGRKGLGELTAEMRAAWPHGSDRDLEEIEQRVLANGIAIEVVLFPILEEFRGQQPEPQVA
jgi:hypothetical protein